MPDVVSYTLNDLITIVDKDRRLAKEVLQKLPDLVTAGEDEDVVFELETPVAVPSLAKLRSELQLGGLDNMEQRLFGAENVLTGVIQSLNILSRQQDSILTSPYWKALDLNANEDGRTTDNLWRANVADGFARYPYEAFDEKPLDRKYDTQGIKFGGKLLPTYTEDTTTEKRYSSATVGSIINVNAYPAFTRYVNWTQPAYMQYQWGYYYASSAYWNATKSNINTRSNSTGGAIGVGLGYAYSSNTGYASYYINYTVPVTTSLGGSTTAQTFRLEQDRVLVGVDIEVVNPGGTKIAANPSLLIVECEQGMPMFNRVVASGSLVDNGNATNTSTTATTAVQFRLTKPTYLRAATSYAIVIIAANTWNVAYSSNADGTGGVFYTQDGQYWAADLQKDMCFALRIADFGASTTTFTLELNSLSLPGGIASLNYSKLIDAPEDGDIEIQIDINNNGNWVPLATMAEVQSLPTYCPLRAVFTGTRYAMPLLDTEISKIVAFRPATALRYISKDRKLNAQSTLKVSYSLFKFDNTDPSEPVHQFSPRLKLVDGPQTTLPPSSLKFDRSTDGIVTKVDAVFTIPAETTTYRHDIIGTTLTANQLYDITSILEII